MAGWPVDNAVLMVAALDVAADEEDEQGSNYGWRSSREVELMTRNATSGAASSYAEERLRRRRQADEDDPGDPPGTAAGAAAAAPPTSTAGPAAGTGGDAGGCQKLGW